ncbi:hypothetical protein FACS1894186_3520 [Alphaproteobacteria bacterium]|nr:hypothetical protein FACS1894186_3520 [Alphaproteobacteria bacterium]
MTEPVPWSKTLVGRACGAADIIADKIYRNRDRFGSVAFTSAIAAIACSIALLPQPAMKPWVGALTCGAFAAMIAGELLPDPLRQVPSLLLQPLDKRREFASLRDWRNSSPLAGGYDCRYNYIAWAMTRDISKRTANP